MVSLFRFSTENSTTYTHFASFVVYGSPWKVHRIYIYIFQSTPKEVVSWWYLESPFKIVLLRRGDIIKFKFKFKFKNNNSMIWKINLLLYISIKWIISLNDETNTYSSFRNYRDTSFFQKYFSCPRWYICILFIKNFIREDEWVMFYRISQGPAGYFEYSKI